MRALAVIVCTLIGTTAGASPLGDAFAAYDRGDLAYDPGPLSGVVNKDYAAWLHGMRALRRGEYEAAEKAFRELAKLKGSRLQPLAAWRLADVAWARGDRAAAAAQYKKLIAAANADELGDVGTAMFRIAEVEHTPAAYRALLVAHPAHPLAAEAEQKMLALGGAPLEPAERIERAKHLAAQHLWDDAVAELALVPAPLPDALAHERDYVLGQTLFDMRRRYGEAAELLLRAYPFLGDKSAEAMFHGARALSRADRDDDAITWYHKVVATYPHTMYAQEASFLAGWLDFNRGHYKDAIAPLEDSLRRYPHTKWSDDALWFLAMAHYFAGELPAAKVALDKLGGAKGMYWSARVVHKLGMDARTGYRDVVTKFPFSWYALLARSRLAELGEKIEPFATGAAARGPALAAEVDESLAKDELIRRADELIAAGLGVDAGLELYRGEKAFLGRHPHDKAFAMLFDRYRKAGNYNRPWMLAVSYSGSALDGPPEGDARRWWEAAYPRAYRELVEKYQALGDNPEFYLYSIMRKESGFDPHDLSYADAQGLLQMIPPTTQRVAATLGIPYDPGKLYEPDYNVHVGSWYIGHLLAKFKKQVPIGAGSFNSGPKPVMKWCETNGDRDIDEMIELVPYVQTREYMKKVTENYARYRYLYAHEVYDQPLHVDKHYEIDQLTY